MCNIGGDPRRAPMIKASDCIKNYGKPELEKNMCVFEKSKYPLIKNLPTIPSRIYMNADLCAPLANALGKICFLNLQHEIKTYDGCFNIRKKNHSKANYASYSLHSWGIAIDINAAWNRYGMKPTLSLALVKCFKEAGFEWGGDWKTPDGMHFELAKIPQKNEPA